MDIDSDQASQDAKAVARALHSLVNTVWENLSHEGRSLFHNFASFTRLVLADAADYVGKSQRNELHIKHKAQDNPQDADPRAKFERTMTKAAGSNLIGAAQVAATTDQDLADHTHSRLQDTLYKACPSPRTVVRIVLMPLQVCDHAQSDENYHNAISTIFDLAQKWIHRSLDTAGDVNQDTSLDAFIDDPTPDKHLINAIHGFRISPPASPSMASSPSPSAASTSSRTPMSALEHQLRNNWKALLDKDSDKGHKWKQDIAALKHEASEFQAAIDRDQDLRGQTGPRQAWRGPREWPSHCWQRRRPVPHGAHPLVLAGHLQCLPPQARWHDQGHPNPEFKDDTTEFVLEDLDISTFSLLPGHVYIRNITDINIKAPSAGQADTAVGALTRIYLQVLQVQLEEVSFYYHNQTASGVNVDIVVRTIPKSLEGLKERKCRRSFIDIQRVDVKVSEDFNLTIKQSNHQILISVFRPVMQSRLRKALQTVLEQHIHSALEWADSFTWEVSHRAEVFSDTGLSRGASFITGFWSELGHLQKGEGGLFLGWKATGTGILKEDAAGAQFAIDEGPRC
ncbi:hypothetical protein BN946_scf185016.g46 [Trametes cinnabarina]|uniref:HAM1-like C-terminal domain-containing protein n=1 Tax=Pycnoporus cinnabarinus TaxID=5643 RepID=A0A060SNU9_PYCCI|nr:hypothetical protein BN946_scf185016.g46 [Trametes cinnabarina]